MHCIYDIVFLELGVINSRCTEHTEKKGLGAPTPNRIGLRYLASGTLSAAFFGRNSKASSDGIDSTALHHFEAL